MRRMTGFTCEGDWCAATLDEGSATTGLLIVSGGNEIRSGAHAGQAAMAAHFAELGYPVFRYDRRGIGDSEGENGGFEASTADITAAVATFRAEAPHVTRIVAFGNCDAATSLALFHAGLGIDRLLLANPWVIEATTQAPDEPSTPSAAAVRARYWARLKNPRSLLDLLTGKIDLKKLARGLKTAATTDTPSQLAARLAHALGQSTTPATILIAERDSTALAFLSAWTGADFAAVRSRTDVGLQRIDSASHSFADAAASAWLMQQIADALKA